MPAGAALEQAVVDDGEVLHLPCGVYLLVTAEHPQPVKVIVRD